MIIENIEYAVGQQTFTGYLAHLGGRTPRPAVLVCPDAGGLREHARSVARRLAEAGYVAFALDLHGQTLDTVDSASAATRVLASDLETLLARANAAYGVLLAQQEVDPARTAAIGFCFGGRVALELARSGAHLQCTVGFHSTLSTAHPADATHIRGKVLVCLGANDPVVPEEQRTAFVAEMTHGNVDFQMLLLPAKHGFTDPDIDRHQHPALAYDETAARRSWAAMLALFDECLGAPVK
ncbi:MAG: dienelactone hydrolase family protein [Polyangiaceae bacterium]